MSRRVTRSPSQRQGEHAELIAGPIELIFSRSPDVGVRNSHLREDQDCPGLKIGYQRIGTDAATVLERVAFKKQVARDNAAFDAREEIPTETVAGDEERRAGNAWA